MGEEQDNFPPNSVPPPPPPTLYTPATQATENKNNLLLCSAVCHFELHSSIKLTYEKCLCFVFDRDISGKPLHLFAIHDHTRVMAQMHLEMLRVRVRLFIQREEFN